MNRAPDCSSRIGARVDLVVMLAGGLRPSPLAAAAGRSVLDLSVDGRQTILEHWLEHLAPLASDRAGDNRPLPVRILHGSALAPTLIADVPAGLELSIERESKEFRGPAGVVKDAAEHLPEGSTVLVVEAARWFAGDLAEIVRAHHQADAHDVDAHEADGRDRSSAAAVTVVAGPRRAPAGIVVLERSTLDPISELGFMDLKEQWLGKVAETGRSVRVFDLGTTPSVLLREREGLLTAARHASEIRSGMSPDPASGGEARSLYAESGPGYFAAVASNSTIEPNTAVVDSVIMSGAVVKSGAIVARSVICPGAVVETAEVVVDQVRSGPTGTPGSSSGRGRVESANTTRGQGTRGEHSR